MQSVQRMYYAIYDACRDADMESLSSVARIAVINALASGGRVDRAREELARARQLWPGTQTIRETELGIEFRYGNFEKSLMNTNGSGPGWPLYISARRDPTDANVDAFLTYMLKSGLDT